MNSVKHGRRSLWRGAFILSPHVACFTHFLHLRSINWCINNYWVFCMKLKTFVRVNKYSIWWFWAFICCLLAFWRRHRALNQQQKQATSPLCDSHTSGKKCLLCFPSRVTRSTHGWVQCCEALITARVLNPKFAPLFSKSTLTRHSNSTLTELLCAKWGGGL